MRLRLSLAALAVSAALATTPRAETVGPVTDEVGVLKIPKGQPILIGGLMVLSGPDIALGLDSSRGAEIAFDDHKNMLVGHPIKYLPEDGQCSVEGGQTGATRLAANKQIAAVVGTACSCEVARRRADPVERRHADGRPGGNGAGADRRRPASGPAGHRPAVYNDLQAAEAAVKDAKAQGYKSAATIHDGSLYAEQLAKAFEAKWKEAGGTITAAEAVQPSDTDMRPVLTRYRHDQAGPAVRADLRGRLGVPGAADQGGPEPWPRRRCSGRMQCSPPRSSRRPATARSAIA